MTPKDPQTLLSEIQSATGWSQPRIAAELKVSQPTVNRLLNRQLDCRGSTLTAINALHRKHVSQSKKRAVA